MQEHKDLQDITLQAKKKALNLLERQDRTQEQLVKKLQGYGYPNEAVEAAVEYVKSFHYIDDRRFAENYIRYRQNEKSRYALKMELYRKGIEEDIIEEALNSAYEAKEEDLVCKLLEKKRFAPDEDDRKERNRIMGYLMRRGFSLEQIKSGMHKYELQFNRKN
ncbi:MAG: regulatory protein RecX [Lachnospiraceae bacterium]